MSQKGLYCVSKEVHLCVKALPMTKDFSVLRNSSFTSVIKNLVAKQFFDSVSCIIEDVWGLI
jgi:hypothetical protein